MEINGGPVARGHRIFRRTTRFQKVVVRQATRFLATFGIILFYFFFTFYEAVLSFFIHVARLFILWLVLVQYQAILPEHLKQINRIPRLNFVKNIDILYSIIQLLCSCKHFFLCLADKYLLQQFINFQLKVYLLIYSKGVGIDRLLCKRTFYKVIIFTQPIAKYQPRYFLISPPPPRKREAEDYSIQYCPSVTTTNN